RELLDDAINRALEARKTISLLAVSVDYLKEMFDARGHTGMRVLREVERIVRAQRGECFRYASYDLLVLIEGGTDDALRLAEAVRKDVEDLRLDFWPELRGTVTVGVATSSPEVQTAYNLCVAAHGVIGVGRARSRLYGQAGYERNRVFVHQ